MGRREASRRVRGEAFPVFERALESFFFRSCDESKKKLESEKIRDRIKAAAKSKKVEKAHPRRKNEDII